MSFPFPPTSWGVVCSLRDQDPEAARRAMTVLCEVYWSPLYAFARRKGLEREEASDLTQGFFLHLLERDTLARADASKGRFRSFLLACFLNFLSNERIRSSARKRAPKRPFTSLNEDDAERRCQRYLADQLTPEDAYERHWAQIVAGRAWQRLETQQRQSSNEERFRILGRYILGDDAAGTYAQVAEKLGTTVPAVKTAVHRLRRDFGKWLRAEATATVTDPADVDDEVRHILRLIEAAGGTLDGRT